MKIINLSFFVVLLNVCAFSAHSLEANSENVPDKLTAKERKEVLQEIDNICGDTWCEGDYNFSFNELKCPIGRSECEMQLEFIDVIYDEGGEPTEELRFPVICQIKGMERKEDIIEIRTPDRITYSEKLYDEVSNCINENGPRAEEFFSQRRT